ncbi:hypothetical protein NFI96_023879 [Prochilodus magdalenae]|nr:hypothetical protein NFI96_023879 [Prochilodus magdalenae]
MTKLLKVGRRVTPLSPLLAGDVTEKRRGLRVVKAIPCSLFYFFPPVLRRGHAHALRGLAERSRPPVLLLARRSYSQVDRCSRTRYRLASYYSLTLQTMLRVTQGELESSICTEHVCKNDKHGVLKCFCVASKALLAVPDFWHHVAASWHLILCQCLKTLPQEDLTHGIEFGEGVAGKERWSEKNKPQPGLTMGSHTGRHGWPAGGLPKTLWACTMREDLKLDLLLLHSTTKLGAWQSDSSMALLALLSGCLCRTGTEQSLYIFNGNVQKMAQAKRFIKKEYKEERIAFFLFSCWWLKKHERRVVCLGLRSLGVILDGQLSFSAHIANLTRSCRFLPNNIRRIRPILSQEATQLLAQCLVISRLDYCNLLLAGLPLQAIRPLQLVQNTAARLIFDLPKFTHITTLLRSLHWLPVAA